MREATEQPYPGLLGWLDAHRVGACMRRRVLLCFVFLETCLKHKWGMDDTDGKVRRGTAPFSGKMKWGDTDQIKGCCGLRVMAGRGQARLPTCLMDNHRIALMAYAIGRAHTGQGVILTSPP